MELDQLFRNASDSRGRNLHIGPFDLDLLGEAFQMRETARVELPLAEKGIPTMVSKSKAESKEKKRKHRKQKDKNKEKDKSHKKHKHHHTDIPKDKNKGKTRHHASAPEHLAKPQDKKRRYPGNEDVFDVHRPQNGQKKPAVIYWADQYAFFGFVILRILED
ncbi:hypothetical protein CCACVL1_16366 [Corchorus capsularis]|uniref:Mediator of RNA polymerase II transcription subunit 19a n=1 Tax=Corchorus capsularis TaxID=210143 RepID=A0A1R3HXB3_COCAP|nr:hypothetical protein CCACVL1_16366 [Corchorus capsularis]